MEIISTNLAERRTVAWNGKSIETGIFKYPVAGPLTLESEDVVGDHVVNRVHHGGLDKACYLFSADVYPWWKEKYPALAWDYGMFGENLTVKGLDEANLLIGDTYAVGGATIQVSQPRQPCFKLGIRFEDQGVLKHFIAEKCPGTYVRVLESGPVKVGDRLKLIHRNENAMSIREVYTLLYHQNPDLAALRRGLEDKALADSAKASFQKRIDQQTTK
ncbi:UNVERIFIED_CONTAM: hypothetical protein GTU68_033232 [Idotea baltica]|nr:hypothetical protein [Idotea baltica]